MGIVFCLLHHEIFISVPFGTFSIHKLRRNGSGPMPRGTGKHVERDTAFLPARVMSITFGGRVVNILSALRSHNMRDMRWTRYLDVLQFGQAGL